MQQKHLELSALPVMGEHTERVFAWGWGKGQVSPSFPLVFFRTSCRSGAVLVPHTHDRCLCFRGISTVHIAAAGLPWPRSSLAYKTWLAQKELLILPKNVSSRPAQATSRGLFQKERMGEGSTGLTSNRKAKTQSA